VQLPFELVPPGFSLAGPGSNSAVLTISDDQSNRASIQLTMQTDAVHVVRMGDTLTGPGSPPAAGLAPSQLPPAVIHADGSNVTGTNPAKIGETISIYVVGLGQPNSSVKTGQASPVPPANALANVDFEFRPNAAPSLPYPPLITAAAAMSPRAEDPHINATVLPAYFAPGYAGLYQINVTIPAPPVPIARCATAYTSTNLTVNIGGLMSFDGAAICVAPPQQQ